MLFGSTLDVAYSPLDSLGGAGSDDFLGADFAPLRGNAAIQEMVLEREQAKPQKVSMEVHAPTPAPVQKVVRMPAAPAQAQPTYNQYEAQAQAQAQAQAAYMRQMQQQAAQVAPAPAAYYQPEPGYFEKLFSKKKEFTKMMQWVLIIVLAISTYYFIDHYLTMYLTANDLSPERELILRALYPLGVLFILWNLRVFSKP